MSWWETAYPGGRMVGPAFIRPLYPPSASSRGKKPSEPGDDVKAVKRGLWRGGRWSGPEHSADYTNAIAHGKGGNVAETGVAGFQRQMGIDPTGWIGEGTYNALRSARIPEGLPNFGAPLLDAVAVRLLENAQKEILGETATVRALALAKARSFIGYRESPPRTNANQFGAWYGMNYEPWCAMFVTYCYEVASEGGSPSFMRGSRYAYCPYILNDARQGKNGLVVTGDPEPGDLVLYDWRRDGLPDHIGLFERWTSGRAFQAVEGNTAVGNDSNGGEVMRRFRDAGGTRVDFVRVREP